MLDEALQAQGITDVFAPIYIQGYWHVFCTRYQIKLKRAQDHKQTTNYERHRKPKTQKHESTDRSSRAELSAPLNPSL